MDVHLKLRVYALWLELIELCTHFAQKFVCFYTQMRFTFQFVFCRLPMTGVIL
jgi:hypothetical protein